MSIDQKSIHQLKYGTHYGNIFNVTVSSEQVANDPVILAGLCSSNL